VEDIYQEILALFCNPSFLGGRNLGMCLLIHIKFIFGKETNRFFFTLILWYGLTSNDLYSRGQWSKVSSFPFFFKGDEHFTFVQHGPTIHILNIP
jgi:hypothetical protein